MIKNLILKEMTLKSEVNRLRGRSNLEAKHEIKNLILKEMTLKSEVNMLRRWPSTRSRTSSSGR